MVEKEKSKLADNVVAIGQKDFMSYVNAVMMQLRSGKFEEVLIVARGNSCKFAIDVAMAVKRFMNNVEVNPARLGSEQFKRENRNKPDNVSTIEIPLKIKSS